MLRHFKFPEISVEICLPWSESSSCSGGNKRPRRQKSSLQSRMQGVPGGDPACSARACRHCRAGPRGENGTAVSTAILRPALSGQQSVIYQRSHQLAFSDHVGQGWGATLGVKYTGWGVQIHKIHCVSSPLANTHRIHSRIHTDTCPPLRLNPRRRGSDRHASSGKRAAAHARRRVECRCGAVGVRRGQRSVRGRERP